MINHKQKNLFHEVRKEKEEFTGYERFMYNDNQKTTPNSAQVWEQI